MRYVKGHFVLTGLDVPSMRFKSRPEARDSVQADDLHIGQTALSLSQSTLRLSPQIFRLVIFSVCGPVCSILLTRN